MRTSVVLPEPFGPSRPYRSPARTSRSTESTASTAPKLLATDLVTIMPLPGLRRELGGRALQQLAVHEPGQHERARGGVGVQQDGGDQPRADDHPGPVPDLDRDPAVVARGADQVQPGDPADLKDRERGQAPAVNSDLAESERRREPGPAGQGAGEDYRAEIAQRP